MPIEEGEVKLYFKIIDEKLDGIHNRLDTLNSKVNTNSTAIAVLDALRKQEQQENQATAKNQGAIWGSLGAGVLLMLDVAYKYFSGAGPK